MDSGIGNEKRCWFRNQFQFPSFIASFSLSFLICSTSPRPTVQLQTDCEFKMKQSSSTAKLLLFQYCVSEHAKKYFEDFYAFGTPLV